MQIRFCLLLAALCACCLGLATPKSELIDIPKISPAPAVKNVTEGTVPSSVSDESTKVEPNAEPSTEPKPKLTPSTPAPTTTTPATTTTTTPATTTTTTTTTTPAPTTPAPSPDPTPNPNPSPNPAPTPKPEPSPTKGNWSYVDPATNVTCMLVQFAAQLKVTYTIANTTNMTATVTLNVPANASVVAGSCEGVDQYLTLSWPVKQNSSKDSNDTNTMMLKYHKNDTTKSYELDSLKFELSPAQFTNATSSSAIVLTHGSDWKVPLASSYRCTPESHMTLSAASGAVAVLTLWQLQEEAFRTSNTTTFSAARECGGGDVPDAVPIAVGCALGGLVVVVLVAYLVGRRRSAARGYLSM